MAVTMLGGFWPHVTAEAAHTLLTAEPSRRLLCCASLDEALAAPDGTVVVLPEDCEPDEVRTAWEPRANAPSVTTVVPADLVLDGLTSESAIGDLVARQIEQADSVLLTGRREGDDEWETEQIRVLLRRIAPWAGHGVPITAGRAEPLSPVTRGLRGHAVGVHEPVPDHGVVSCVFHARRPFHPGRLHDALDDVTENVLRSRGHFWLATRPDLAMTWESAGELSLGPVSGWLDALPLDQWSDVDTERRLAAEIDWDPYYGDRHHHLAFIGIDLDPVHIHRVLSRCLLTDYELADGEEAWRRLPDPFQRPPTRKG
ncbi:GTP-binding protein [Actinoplanes sp. NPDC000266]